MSARKMCKVTPKRATKPVLKRMSFDNISSSTSSDEELSHKQVQLLENNAKVDSPIKESKEMNPVFESVMETDFTSEMSKMLNMFGTDMSKALLAKNKRLEQFTEGAFEHEFERVCMCACMVADTATVQASNSRVQDMCKRQAHERGMLLEEVKNSMSTALDQWEHDIKHSEEQEEKIIKIAQQQVKMLQQTRLHHMEQVMKLRQLCSAIPKKAEDVEGQHRKECEKMQSELKMELSAMQKKIMLDTQKEELANMQKTLQNAWLM